jgi:hypothetical protein
VIERVGAVDAQHGTLMYSGQGRDGSAPGYTRAHYTSLAAADVVFAHLLERCRLLGLQTTEKAKTASEGELSASCGRAADDDYHVHFSVRSGRPTEVSMAEDIDDGVSASQQGRKLSQITDLRGRASSGIPAHVRRRGRVAEGGGLLNRYRVVKPYRGFESLRLRQPCWPRKPRRVNRRLRSDR